MLPCKCSSFRVQCYIVTLTKWHIANGKTLKSKIWIHKSAFIYPISCKESEPYTHWQWCKKEKRKGALSVRPKSPSNKEREVGVIMYKNLLSRSAEFHWDDLIGWLGNCLICTGLSRHKPSSYLYKSQITYISEVMASNFKRLAFIARAESIIILELPMVWQISPSYTALWVQHLCYL